MSDENIQDEDLDIDESAAESKPQKKGSLFSPFLIRILIIVASVLGMIFVSIIVFIIGAQFIKVKSPDVRPDGWDEQILKTERTQLEYMEVEDPFRQQLLDGKMIQLKITLGYKMKDKALQQELSQIKPEIRDIIIKHLSHLSSEYFVDMESGGSSLEKLEEDFLKQINRLLNTGKVQRILFQEYTLMQ